MLWETPVYTPSQGLSGLGFATSTGWQVQVDRYQNVNGFAYGGGNTIPASSVPGYNATWKIIFSAPETELSFALPDGSTQVFYFHWNQPTTRSIPVFVLDNIVNVPAPAPSAPPPPPDPYQLTHQNFGVQYFQRELASQYSDQEIQGFYNYWTLGTNTATNPMYAEQIQILNSEISRRGLSLTQIPIPQVAPPPIPPDPLAITKGQFFLDNWTDSLASQYSDLEIKGFYGTYISSIAFGAGVVNPYGPQPDIYKSLNAEITRRNLSLAIIPDCPSGYGRVQPGPYLGHSPQMAMVYGGDSGNGYLPIPNSTVSHFWAVNTIYTSGPDPSTIYHVSDFLDLTTGDHYGLSWTEAGGSGGFLGIKSSAWTTGLEDVAVAVATAGVVNPVVGGLVGPTIGVIAGTQGTSPLKTAEISAVATGAVAAVGMTAGAVEVVAPGAVSGVVSAITGTVTKIAAILSTGYATSAIKKAINPPPGTTPYAPVGNTNIYATVSPGGQGPTATPSLLSGTNLKALGALAIGALVLLKKRK